ncbi:septation protein SepH [Corynebacterium frankenforstense]
MRELYLVPGESSDTSLVLSDAPEQSEEAARFRVTVTDELRALLRPGTEASTDDAAPSDAGENGTEGASGATPLFAAAEESGSDASTGPTAEAAEPAHGAGHATGTDGASASSRGKEPDPRLSVPLTMRPREIQDRVRGGATITELADEMGVAESRVEPFAHPVLLERARIAELARGSHPVRDDGPAKLPLSEVLATAFAARDIDPAGARWDAFRDHDGQWVVAVSWQTGMTDHRAEWTLQDHMTSSSTTVARNATAAELTDPESARPVRTLTPLDGGAGDQDFDDHEDAQGPAREDRGGREPRPADAEAEDRPEEADEEGSFLRHPDPEDKPSKRRRRAVTPHWEDVLLGVRTNTKRPRK